MFFFAFFNAYSLQPDKSSPNCCDNVESWLFPESRKLVITEDEEQTNLFRTVAFSQFGLVCSRVQSNNQACEHTEAEADQELFPGCGSIFFSLNASYNNTYVAVTTAAKIFVVRLLLNKKTANFCQQYGCQQNNPKEDKYRIDLMLWQTGTDRWEQFTFVKKSRIGKWATGDSSATAFLHLNGRTRITFRFTRFYNMQ